MESIAHAPSEGAPVVDWGWNYDIWERGRHKPNTKNIKVMYAEKNGQKYLVN